MKKYLKPENKKKQKNKSKSKKTKSIKIKRKQIKKPSIVKNKKSKLKIKTKNKSSSYKKILKKIQIGKGKEIKNEVAIGTAFTALYDRLPEKKDELEFKKNDIIYVMSSPSGGWWFGVSRNAIEKALLKQKSKENINEVVIQLIDYLYKNPSKIKKSLLGELLGWFPTNYVKLYIADKSIVKSILKMFDTKKKKIELPSSAFILETLESSPSPILEVPPVVKRRLSKIPSRR